MVEEPKRTIAYLCPSCRQSVVVEKTVFSLAAAPSAIPCPCGKSALKTEIIGDRVKLTVPCLFCEKEHTVSCSTHAFSPGENIGFLLRSLGTGLLLRGRRGAGFCGDEAAGGGRG